MANVTFFEYHFLSIIMKGGEFILEKKAKRKMKRKKENKDPHISWKFLDSDNRGIGPLRGPRGERSELTAYVVSLYHSIKQYLPHL